MSDVFVTIVALYESVLSKIRLVIHVNISIKYTRVSA